MVHDLCIVVCTCSLFTSLPRDIHLKIASFLTFRDVCALGRCSRYWRELCASDSIWKPLSIIRWPSLPTHRPTNSIQQNWKHFYHRRHLRLCSLAGSQRRYYRGGNFCRKFPTNLCKELASYGFGFADVMLFSFRTTVMLFINMIGVLYSIKFLKVPRKIVAKALRRCKIHDRDVIVSSSGANILYRALVPRKNLDSCLTLEDVALGRRGEELFPWQKNL